MIYNTKEEFLVIGVEAATLNPYAIHTDCEICLQPLQMFPDVPATQQNGSSPTSSTDSTAVHPALHILACRHVIGTDCLIAWLETGNTCPICSRILFTPPSEQPISQEEVNWVVAALEPLIGEERLYRWVAKHMAKGMAEEVRKKRMYENKVVTERSTREQRERAEREMYALGDGDIMEVGNRHWSDEEGEGDEHGEDANWSGEEVAGDAGVEDNAPHGADLLE